MAGRAATPARTDIAAGAAARTQTAVAAGRGPGSRAERAAVGTAAGPAAVSPAAVSPAPVSTTADRAGTGGRAGASLVSPRGPATGPPPRAQRGRPDPATGHLYRSDHQGRLKRISG